MAVEMPVVLGEPARPLTTRRRSATVTVSAPAKINLGLHVTGQRPDGYHLLESLTVFGCDGAADVITATDADADSFAVKGRFGGALDGAKDDNLVIKARNFLRALAVQTNRAAPPVAITLTKQLPVASGIGGGSADAAATLRALIGHWRLPGDLLNGHRAMLVGALGADVPMCLSGVALMARGIGERIEPVAGLPPLPAIIVNPGRPVATPEVFDALQTKANPPMPAIPAEICRSTASLAAWLATHTRNDLQPPAIAMVPEIADVLEAIGGHGARLARMSGSGATCFGLFDDFDQVHAAASAIAGKARSWWIRPTLLNSNGTKA